MLGFIVARYAAGTRRSVLPNVGGNRRADGPLAKLKACAGASGWDRKVRPHDA